MKRPIQLKNCLFAAFAMPLRSLNYTSAACLTSSLTVRLFFRRSFVFSWEEATKLCFVNLPIILLPHCQFQSFTAAAATNYSLIQFLHPTPLLLLVMCLPWYFYQVPAFRILHPTTIPSLPWADYRHLNPITFTNWVRKPAKTSCKPVY